MNVIETNESYYYPKGSYWEYFSIFSLIENNAGIAIAPHPNSKGTGFLEIMKQKGLAKQAAYHSSCLRGLEVGQDKEKILKLYSMEPPQVSEAYYALPYNPYGKREDYEWSFPARWFNMKEDEAVLIGVEFWEKIGGVGTYQAFIDAVNEIGPEYKDRIYREYLGIEPPPDLDKQGI